MRYREEDPETVLGLRRTAQEENKCTTNCSLLPESACAPGQGASFETPKPGNQGIKELRNQGASSGTLIPADKYPSPHQYSLSQLKH
jgi:hypothetical protein